VSLPKIILVLDVWIAGSLIVIGVFSVKVALAQRRINKLNNEWLQHQSETLIQLSDTVLHMQRVITKMHSAQFGEPPTPAPGKKETIQ
jgi:hypothetical protein